MSFVIDLLKNKFASPSKERIVSEYRLTCSGCLYNGNVETFDWTKSSTTRNLSNDYFQLFVASQPHEHYPQELALLFSCPYTTSTHNNTTGQESFTYRPDDEVASDLATLITLFARRLVTIASKVRVIHPQEDRGVQETPFPIQGEIGQAWPMQPSQIITSPSNTGVDIKIKSYMPVPLGFNVISFNRFLQWFSSKESNFAKRFLAAARLYQQALRLFHEEVGVAYQLLISSVETVAGMTEEAPSLAAIMLRRKDLIKHLRGYGLKEKQIEETVKIATSGISWVADKFIKFVENNVSDDVWQYPDPLYPGPGESLQNFMVTKAELWSSLKEIYQHRSAASHGGKPYPDYISMGLTPFVRWDSLLELSSLGGWPRPNVPKPEGYVLPIICFERLVHSALWGHIANDPQFKGSR